MIKGATRELDLKFKTRLMEHFEERFAIKDIQEFWKKAAQGPSLKVLEIALVEFSDGAIKDVNAAADFIDDYIAQDGKTVETDGKPVEIFYTVETLYAEIIQEINDKGFFKTRMTPEELKTFLESPSLDMQQIINDAVKEAGKTWVAGTGEKKSQNIALLPTTTE
ncbi:MAG TPA: hypothetical protein VHP31_12300 [Caproicibacter sp.]|nr:hypothetical protein [Caproicibacter sp.]